MWTKALVVFDGDETLWRAEGLYDHARAEAAAVVESVGLDPEEWTKLQQRIDLQNVSRLGLSSRRFPTSCAEAYRALVAETGGQIDAPTERRIRSEAARVFDAIAPTVDGCGDVLDALSQS
jgi:phosphoglycolate phosphatase-like HAD superfamily hydrolase